MSINHWPVHERPREKLLKYGTSALSAAELLAICLRTGTKGKSVLALSRELLNKFGSLSALFNASEKACCNVAGLGQAKYIQLQAMAELNRRVLFEPLQEQTVFHHPQQVRDYLLSKLGHLKREVFACLFLTSQNRVICFEELFQGSIKQADVYPREIVKSALQVNAASVIFAHNHPSGDATPSFADKEMTLLLQSALEVIDVSVLDHFVVGAGEVVSFVEMGFL